MIEYIRDFDPDTAIEVDIVRGYLLSQGFSVDPCPANFLRFTRSNRFATMFAFRPVNWSVEIQIALRIPSVTMIVHTTGQIVTRRERRYFQATFDELIAVISSRSEDHDRHHAMVPTSNHAIARRESNLAFRENVGGVLLCFAIPILVIVLVIASVPTLWALITGVTAPSALYYAWSRSIKYRRGDARLGKQIETRAGVAPTDRWTQRR